ncbi:glycosyltransferase, partial [Nitrospira sp. BLG_2]|uniref:glycosyltransferase n=1 Tax=Nitrospira sp. BLG_2 TaxID=3397507 RepID=UPI003B9BDC7F
MKLALENAPNDRIPKFIHFIWAGGIKLMDDEREVETVVGWCKANPHCRVHLWVDYDTYPKTARPLLDRYKQIFGAHEIKVVTDVGDNENKVSSLIIRDISEIEDYRGLLALAKSEIKQLYPNFGCSSDIIRLLILRKGGCYFDQDVRCNPCLSLEESGLFERHGLPLIVLEHRPQRATPDAPMKFESAGSVVIHGERDSSSSPDSKASLTVKAASSSEEAAEGSQSPSHNLTPKSESSSDNSYKRFLKLTFDELGNDAIICTPNHPMIIRQLDRIYDNYHLKVSQSALRTAECYGERDRRNRSIIRTGPDVTQTVFREQIRPYIQELDSGGLKLYYLHDEDHVIEFDSESDDDLRHEKLVGAFEFQTMRSRLRELTIPDNNYQNWLRVPIQNISDIGACHKTIIERIKFEIKHFKI